MIELTERESDLLLMALHSVLSTEVTTRIKGKPPMEYHAEVVDLQELRVVADKLITEREDDFRDDALQLFDAVIAKAPPL